MEVLGREVEVFVRVRPTAVFAHDLIECLPDGQTVHIRQRRDCKKQLEGKKSQQSAWSFQLDGVLQNVSQEDTYSQVCRGVMFGALDGYNGTVICFGQTGAGKTYTMTGSSESYKHRGLVPRALQELFHEVQMRTERVFSVHLSYLEIYNETLVDLLPSPQTPPHLPPKGLAVMEEPGGGVLIRGLSLHPVRNEEEALHLFFEGEMNRIIGSHSLNRQSSRSHCVLTVHIESHSRTAGDAKYITSKLSLVDLAGSERLAKTGSEGEMLKEARYINKSLSFLEQAVLALVDCRRDHVPFRQSKLTHALKDSFSGNCNIVLVANIYAEVEHIEETLSTLRFASRMKCVQMRPVINVHVDPAAQIKKLEKEVQMLKDKLSTFNMENQQSSQYEPLTEAERAEIENQVRGYLEGRLEGISITGVSHAQAAFAQFKLVVQMQEQKVKTQQHQIHELLIKNQTATNSDTKEWDTNRNHEQNKQPTSAGVANKKSKVKGRQEGTPVAQDHLEKSSKPKLTSAQTPEREQEPDPGHVENQETRESRLSAAQLSVYRPPSKAEAFEDFKKGRGSKINLIFKENKAILLERRCQLCQLSKEVHDVKSDVDGIMVDLNRLKRREGQDVDAALQEQKDSLLGRLGELKAHYKQRYKLLSHIQAEVNYCQHLVDQCRARLFSEFEIWYEQSFQSAEENEMSAADSTQEGNSQRSESLYSRSPSLKARNGAVNSFSPRQNNLS